MKNCVFTGYFFLHRILQNGKYGNRSIICTLLLAQCILPHISSFAEWYDSVPVDFFLIRGEYDPTLLMQHFCTVCG